MATINIGSIKFKWQGAYAGGTAYTVDDVVSYNGSSYICILASTGNLPTNATYWEQMSSAGTNGTDGTDLGTTLTTQGDLVYRDGSGLARLGAGTSGQALITNGTGANPSWGTISSGTYSVHKIEKYSYATTVAGAGYQTYHDIAGGNYLTFNPTSTDDFVFFSGFSNLQDTSAASGGTVYVNYGTSTTLGSSDTKVQFHGTHSNYTGSVGDFYRTVYNNCILACTGLSVGTNYYAELAGATHNPSTTTDFNHDVSDRTSDGQHGLMLIHYKKN